MSIEINSSIRVAFSSDNNFDSRLLVDRVEARRNADLVIEVRVHFHRRDGGRVRDGAAVTHTTRDWTSDREFQFFVSRCQSALEAAYSGRLWLQPDGDWGVRVTCPEGHYRPNLKCLLKVVPVAAGNRKHLWLDCYRVNPSYCPTTPAAVPGATVFTSWMESRNLGFTRNYGRLVNVDAQSCMTHATEGHTSVIAVHEFYHFLGFRHVAVGSPACPASGNTNATACYGGTLHQRGSAGGWGNRIETWMDRPWRRALARHQVQIVQWAATMTRLSPRLIAA